MYYSNNVFYGYAQQHNHETVFLKQLFLFRGFLFGFHIFLLISELCVNFGLQ